MKIKDYVCKCGCNDFFFADKGNQKGVYCTKCGKWFKWADKDEQNLIMRQELVLDKIRAEIERLQKMCDKDDLNLLAQYSAFGMVLEIIDKYKAESEEIICK